MVPLKDDQTGCPGTPDLIHKFPPFLVSNFKSFIFRFPLVPAEEVIIRKERASGNYRLSAYYLGKCVSEAPLVVCYPLGFLLIFYWLCGLNPSVAFLGQALNLVANSILAQVRAMHDILLSNCTKQVASHVSFHSPATMFR